MSEINNINTIQRIQPTAPKKGKQDTGLHPTDKDFAELLQTVEKLESMDNELDSVGSEINKVVNQSDIKNTLGVSTGVNKIGGYIKNMEGLVEKLSADKRTDSKYGITQYSKTNKTEKS